MEMLLTLIRNAVPSATSSDGLGMQDYRERAIARILASAPDAAAFDYMFYRANPGHLRQAVGDYKRILDMQTAARFSVVPGDWDGLDRYIGVAAGAQQAKRNNIKFLIDGPAVEIEGGKALRAAKSSIHIELFQLQADNIGQGLARVLSEKAKEGVKVRLLIDAKGSDLEDDNELKKLIENLRSSGVWVYAQKPPLLQDHLDHRKVVVIDGQIGFTGGMNVGRLYQVDWHDQQTLIMGPAVAELQKAFVERWYLATDELLSGPGLYQFSAEVPGGAETRVVPHTGKRDQNIKAVYLRAIGTAQRSIRIANPYFTDEDVVDALNAAARRGVKVQVVLPRENDEPIVQHASRYSYPKLLKAGVEIYEYPSRMAHEKVAVMDGRWATFGSSNLDARSFYNNDELNLVVTDAGLAQDIEQRLFDTDIARSTRITHYSPDAADHAAGQIDGFL